MALPEAHPNVAIQGNSGVKLQQESISFNPETGYETHRTYSGPRSAILGHFNAFANDGWICSCTHEGPLYKLVVQTIDPFVADRWERVVEWAQISILQTPGLYGAASVEELAQWNVDTDFELSRGPLSTTEKAKQLAMIALWEPGKQTLYRLKGRGMTSFETKRYVLRLRRTIRATDIANASQADAEEVVYSTAKLKDLFGVPDAIAAKLPVAPDTVPIDLQWGWRNRTDDVETNLIWNKAQMVREWVFEAVPTTHYAFVS